MNMNELKVTFGTYDVIFIVLQDTMADTIHQHLL